MRYQHFFWDFDGTLFDTYGRISRCAQKALRDLGIQADIEEVYQMSKHSVRHNFVRFVLPLGIAEEAYMAAYNAHREDEGMESMQPYAGAREMLQMVVQKGGCNYLYTHRGDSSVEALKFYGIDHLFRDCVTSKDGFPLKPAPDALQHLMGKYGLTPDQCIMIGDRDIDVDAGKNAGMHGVLFDPDQIFPDYETPLRFQAFEPMMQALTAEP